MVLFALPLSKAKRQQSLNSKSEVPLNEFYQVFSVAGAERQTTKAWPAFSYLNVKKKKENLIFQCIVWKKTFLGKEWCALSVVGETTPPPLVSDEVLLTNRCYCMVFLIMSSSVLLQSTSFKKNQLLKNSLKKKLNVCMMLHLLYLLNNFVCKCTGIKRRCPISVPALVCLSCTDLKQRPTHLSIVPSTTSCSPGTQAEKVQRASLV